MFKEVLQELSNVEIFPILSLIIFFITFSAVVYWALRLDKEVISEMENLPFNNDTKNGESRDV